MRNLQLELSVDGAEDLLGTRLVVNVNGRPFVLCALPESSPTSSASSQVVFADYVCSEAGRLATAGRTRTAETYRAAAASLTAFLAGRHIALHEVTDDLMTRYERHLRDRGLSMNTTSFYMRILRAAYRRAVEDGLVADAMPFRHVYTGVTLTDKRGLTLDEVGSIHRFTANEPNLLFARDLFMFSFFTRGMAFVDMAYLPHNAVRDGWLHYHRRKTGQPICVQWEEPMRLLVERLKRPGTPFLLPIVVKANGKERNQYRHVQGNVNRWLHELGQRIGLSKPLTMYVARHSWASIAQDQGFSLEAIRQGMGHTTIRTTRIYVQSLNASRVDECNRQIISRLLKA